MKRIDIRSNWTIKELQNIYDLPFNDLLWKAQNIHRKYHNANAVSYTHLPLPTILRV